MMIRVLIKIIIITLCTLNILNAAYASTLTIDSIPIELIDKFLSSDSIENPPPQIERMLTAKKLLSNINTLNTLIPHLDEQTVKSIIEDQKKLNTELLNLPSKKDSDLDKFIDDGIRINSNPQLLQYNLENQIRNIQMNLNCILQSKNIKIEMYCWVKTSELLSNQPLWTDSITYLIKQNPFLNVQFWPSPGHAANLTDTSRMYNAYSRAILAVIILPYLKNNILENEKPKLSYKSTSKL